MRIGWMNGAIASRCGRGSNPSLYALAMMAAVLLSACNGDTLFLGKPSKQQVADALAVVTLISGSVLASVNDCTPQNNGYLCSVTLETPAAHGSKHRIDKQYLLTFGRKHHWVVQTSD
ncbi:MAG: hypothetical protein JWR16_2854 [Nevskia sp.]|nr:hypothetical protein [Nevskia sp.]